tara:strand:- start:4319 stop:4582 length:264 start_codon:yes stop_codon:yes gene_type:complete
MKLESLLKTTASYMLAMNDPSAAAEFMFSKVEQSIADGTSSSEERIKFWESVTTELTSLDPEYSSEVAALYLKIVLDKYKSEFQGPW